MREVQAALTSLQFSTVITTNFVENAKDEPVPVVFRSVAETKISRLIQGRITRKKA